LPSDFFAIYPSSPNSQAVHGLEPVNDRPENEVRKEAKKSDGKKIKMTRTAPKSVVLPPWASMFVG
jgi:hypothetical protein